MRRRGVFVAVGDLAHKLAATGFLKEAADLYLKLAAKMLPSEYGNKASLALTGADGRSEVVTLTAEEAYRRMLGKP